MKSKTTRRALVMSLLSLLLCCSMLVGTTFAWFTDSVTSGRNQIVAGNLDIELEYAQTPDGEYKTVEGVSDIFVAPTGATKGLWEPGHTEVAYLRITNKGSLALQYNLKVDPYTETIGENADGDPIQLSKILKFAATEPSKDAPTAYTRETAQEAAAKATNTVKLTEYAKTAIEMVPGATQYIALVVYMPEEVGNEANYRGNVIPTIEFALTLLATQVVAEKDSFDEYYDANAQLPAVVAVNATAEVKAGEPTTIETPTAQITVPVDATDADELTLTVQETEVYENITINTAEGAITLDVNLVNESGEKVNLNQPANVTVYIGKGHQVKEIRHYNDVIAHTYDPATGYLTFSTESFSPFTVIFNYAGGSGIETNPYLIATAEQLTAAVANKVAYAKLVANIEMDADTTLKPAANMVLDLGGKTLSGVTDVSNGNRNFFDVQKTLTVKNGTITILHTGDNMAWNASTNVFNVTAGGVLNIKNATVENKGGSDMAFAVHLNNWGQVTLDAEKTTFKSTYVGIRVFNSGYDMNNVTLKECEIKSGNSCFWVHNYTEADFGTADKAAAQAKLLNFKFVNTETISENKPAVRLGMTNSVYYSDLSMNAVVTANLTDIDSLLAGGKNVVLNGDLSFSSSNTTANSGYGATGLSVKGGVLDGNGKSLGINNWGTWDCAVHTTGGTIKNLTINSGMRGIFMGSATADVYIDNVTIDGTVYTFNSDGGSKDYGVYISNSTLNGWTSFSAVHKEVVFKDCSFGEGQGYAFCRPYNDATFEGCAFAAGYKIDAIGAITFENCTIGGQPLTAENLATLVTSNIANATVK